MANPMMEPLEPYRSHASETTHEDYDWDYEEERGERPPMNILWGRVAVLGGLLLIAFLFGRATTGGGASDEQLKNARAKAAQLGEDNATLTQQNQDLQTQLDQANAQLAAPDTTGETAEQPAEGEEGGGGSAAPTGETYVVKSGDSLSSIAEKFYGDSSLDDYLAEVNDISDPTALHVGQELLIPDNPPDN